MPPKRGAGGAHATPRRGAREEDSSDDDERIQLYTPQSTPRATRNVSASPAASAVSSRGRGRPPVRPPGGYASSTSEEDDSDRSTQRLTQSGRSRAGASAGASAAAANGEPNGRARGGGQLSPVVSEFIRFAIGQHSKGKLIRQRDIPNEQRKGVMQLGWDDVVRFANIYLQTTFGYSLVNTRRGLRRAGSILALSQGDQGEAFSQTQDGGLSQQVQGERNEKEAHLILHTKGPASVWCPQARRLLRGPADKILRGQLLATLTMVALGDKQNGGHGITEERLHRLLESAGFEKPLDSIKEYLNANYLEKLEKKQQTAAQQDAGKPIYRLGVRGEAEFGSDIALMLARLVRPGVAIEHVDAAMEKFEKERNSGGAGASARSDAAGQASQASQSVDGGTPRGAPLRVFGAR